VNLIRTPLELLKQAMPKPLKPPPVNWKPELEGEARDHEWRYIAGKNTDGSGKKCIIHRNARKRIQHGAMVTLITSKSMRERSYEEHVFLKNRAVRKKEISAKYRLGNKDKRRAYAKVYHAKRQLKEPGYNNASCKKWASKQGLVKNRERARVYRENNRDKVVAAKRAARCKQSNDWWKAQCGSSASS
jgi:hypothetical protein